mmetsp:Transcript_54817/g.155958  ORF Transcript_54817/g.155958 Transcript_54817/m.155958 type:complete len:476 (-) Transcript_54817:44-1471(-)
MMVLSDTADYAAVGLSGWLGKDFYHQAIIPLVVITVILAWFARPSTAEEIPAGFRKFQAAYLAVWVFCVGADWFQGPYVYALYSAYGYERSQIAQLFVGGFVSSLVFSCIVGAVCDRFGRKRCALAYCFLYIVSCLTKHVNIYGVLMMGRITGGIATSLLFSCFECWMVSEHLGRHKFSAGLLNYMFGIMFSVMYLVAIVVGFIGEVLVSGFKFTPYSEGSVIYHGGDLVPFDASIICLLIGGVLIAAFWNENYGTDSGCGSSEEAAGMVANVSDALRLFCQDNRVFFLCAVVAFFEGSMYSFVFNWTPALDSRIVPPPYGLIFSLFMMACMCGASTSTILSGSMRATTRLGIALMVSAISLVVAAIVAHHGKLALTFCSFIVFEFCVGLYFPAIGLVKSEVVPERVRATMYNIYRVPLNAVVVALLLTNISFVRVFAICAVLMGVAFVGVVLTAAMPQKVPGSVKGFSAQVKNV